MLGTAEIIGIVAGSILGAISVFFLLLLIIRIWVRRPTSGSDNPKRLDGKTVVITGGNTGIGKATAIELAKKGARVIILCRNQTRAEEAVESIKNESNSSSVEYKLMDLSSLKSVRKCAQDLLDSEEKIDILVNNAGVSYVPETKTEDGFELTFATNHLGHFLLTDLLMPLIKKSESSGFKPRIVIVSALAHKFINDIDWNNLNGETNYNPVTAYILSKLANLYHARELAKRLNGTNILVYSLHPGIIATELTRHFEGKYPRLAGCLNPLARFTLKTPFYGAQTTIYCCLEDKIENDSGKYFDGCREATISRLAQNEENQKKMWEISEQMVGLK